MSKLDLNYEALTELRDLLVSKIRHEHKQLGMRTYVNVPIKQADGHFCASAACVLGWGAVSKLQQTHPLLAPLYQLMELAEKTIPLTPKTRDAMCYNDVYTDMYTAISQLYSGIIMNCTSEYKTPPLPEISGKLNWGQFKGMVIRSSITDIPSDATIQKDGMEYELAWDFMFGTCNKDSIDHAIWRLNYVLEHHSSPLFYSVNQQRATKTTIAQLLELEGSKDILHELHSRTTEHQNTDQFMIPVHAGEYNFLEFAAHDALVELCTKNGDVWLTQ